MGSDMTLCAILNLKEHGEETGKIVSDQAAELEIRETQRKDYRIFCMGRQTSESLYHCIMVSTQYCRSTSRFTVYH